MKQLIILAFFAFTSVAFAFEVNLMKFGMQKNDALTVLKSRNLSVSPIIGSEKDSYLATATNGLTEAVTFCHDVLNSYQYDIDGNIESFVRATEKETLTFGQGSYEVTSRQTPAGEWNTISFFWIKNDFKNEINFSKIGNYNPQIYIRYSKNSECK
jgi:hypothetical protein